MSNNIIEEIKDRANIVDIISDYVTLQKRGANYQGLCPFHSEKTPSFVVSENKQIFTCFGCGAKGDVIEFLKRQDNLTFMEAVEKLANRYGINLENRGFNQDKKNDIYYEINREAAIFFYKSLLKENSRGLKYVGSRKISADTIYEFGIGYADEEWDSLYKYLKSKNYDEKFMIELGLISKSKGKYYDKFRDRLIFPIKDVRGRVIGFGGRSLGDDMPKYLNSPENKIFQKKNNLYGLNLSKDNIAKENRAILVEGYMDVVSLYQNGVKSVAASLGTALTENQGKLLKRYAKNVILSYDSDNAGITAAIRGGEILKKQGIKVKVLNVDEGKDPDEYIKSKGKLAYLELCERAPWYNDYVIKNIEKQYNLELASDKVDFSKELVKFLNSLNPMERDIYIDEICSHYGFDRDALSMETGEVKELLKAAEKTEHKEAVNDGILAKEKMLIKIMMEDSYFVNKFNELDVDFITPEALDIFQKINEANDLDSSVRHTTILENLSQERGELLDSILKETTLVAGFEREFEGIVSSLRKEQLILKRDQLLNLIEIASEENRQEEVKKLIQEHKKIQREIKLGGSI